MLGVVLQGEACAIFLRVRTPVRSRKYKRVLVLKNAYHRERTSPAWAVVGSAGYVIRSLYDVDGFCSISLILMLRFLAVCMSGCRSEKE